MKHISWIWKVSNLKSEIFNEYKVFFGHVKDDTTSSNCFVNKTVKAEKTVVFGLAVETHFMFFSPYLSFSAFT